MRSSAPTQRCLEPLRQFADESVQGGVGLCLAIAVVMFAGVIGSFLLCGKMASMAPSEDPETLKESHDDKGKEYLD